MPIYVAKAKEGDTDAVRLIKAKTSAGAMSFATKGLVEVELAYAEAVHELATKGVKIEDASAEPAPAAQTGGEQQQDDQ